jgi:hypothetical protein
MILVRKHLKLGARLALFSLLVQFALSFGHFHALAAPSDSVVAPSASASLRTALVNAVDLTAQAEPQRVPTKHDGDQRDHDGCAICAVVAIASAAFFSSPPVLLAPEAFELFYCSTDAEFIHLKSADTSFQPRAPPAS